MLSASSISLSIACFLSSATVTYAAQYSIALVGVGPEQVSAIAQGINAEGDVTGFTAGNPMYAFEFASIFGSGNTLGTFPGGTVSLAFATNKFNQITGYADVPSATLPEQQHAFLYSYGVMKDLGTLGGTISGGYAVNNSAQVAGFSYLAGDTVRHAFLYSDGTMIDLGVLPGTAESSAMGINDAGEIVGETYLAGGYNYHAFVYAHGTMTDLGTLGGPLSNATAINNAGEIVGYASLSTYAHYASDGTGLGAPTVHAFLDVQNQMVDLGTLGGDSSEAYALNDLGQVVGESEITSGKPDQHAFLYSNGVMVDLNSLVAPDSGWVLQDATGINDSGQITGNGTFDGQADAFLLTPNGASGATITGTPEPASLGVLAVGALMLVRRRSGRA